MKPKAVVFDIGNVLVEWNPERLFDSVLGEDRRRQMFAAVDLQAMNFKVDLGANFKETVYAMADAHPEWRDEVRMWHDCWMEMTAEIPHSVRLLRALRAKEVPVFALSNFGIQTFELAVTHYPCMDEFDRKYVSGHLQVAKPDPGIYQILEEECGVAPGALLFADDLSDNIDMALGRGWRTHLFEGPQGWADRLVGEGLLSPQEAI